MPNVFFAIVPTLKLIFNLLFSVDIEEETKALKNVLKSYDTTEKQLDCLIRKYVELANQNKVSETKCEVVTKKNEQANMIVFCRCDLSYNYYEK